MDTTYSYIGVDADGIVKAASVDTGDNAEALAQDLGEYVLSGLTIHRIPVGKARIILGEPYPSDDEHCWTLIEAEVRRAREKFPKWCSDPLHALAVVEEEKGELSQAILQYLYEPEKNVTRADIKAEAIQMAAMAFRWLRSWDRYQFNRGEEHHQS